jgi:tetratricopeptide (TPR) repeat protein
MIRRVTFILALAGAGTVPVTDACAAFTVTTKDGDTFITDSLTTQGTKLQILIPGQPLRTLEAAIVERIEMPEPPAYAEARNAFLAGNTVGTLQAMGKLRAELEPLKNIPGTRDWWLDGEFLRAHILLSQRREREAEAALKEIAADTRDEDSQRHARAFLAHMTGLRGDPKLALDELRKIILETTDPDVLADAWLFVGQHAAATNDHQAAILAYLRVPVFYPGKMVALAAAQLGAARAFMPIDNGEQARKVLNDLIAKLPNTAEAAEARKLVAQIDKDLGAGPPAETPANSPQQPPPADTPTEKPPDQPAPVEPEFKKVEMKAEIRAEPKE